MILQKEYIKYNAAAKTLLNIGPLKEYVHETLLAMFFENSYIRDKNTI